MEMTGKQGSIAREYLIKTVSGWSDPSFCKTTFLTWLIVTTPKLRLISGLVEGEGVGLEDGRFPYLHIWWSLYVLELAILYEIGRQF